MHFIGNSKGFTLVEIVLALGILVIGIVSILSLFPVGLDSSRKSREYTDASLLASYKIADILYNLDDSVINASSYPTSTPDPEPFTKNPSFSWHYYTSVIPIFTVQKLYRVDVLIYSVQDTSDPLLSVVTYIRTKKN